MDMKTTVTANRIGIVRGQDLYDDEYDFDEMNPEIAEMFMKEDTHIEQEKMEDHAILSERLEDQLKAVKWAKAEQKRILKEKGERLSKELMAKMMPFILNQ